MSNSNLPSHVFDACDDIDAAVFTGTLLFDVKQIKELQRYIDSWQRAINEALAEYAADPNSYDVD